MEGNYCWQNPNASLQQEEVSLRDRARGEYLQEDDGGKTWVRVGERDMELPQFISKVTASYRPHSDALNEATTVKTVPVRL